MTIKKENKRKEKQDYEMLQARFKPKFPTWAPQLNVWSIKSQTAFMQRCCAPEEKNRGYMKIESKEEKKSPLQARIEPKYPTRAPQFDQFNVWSIQNQTALKKDIKKLFFLCIIKRTGIAKRNEKDK